MRVSIFVVKEASSCRLPRGNPTSKHNRLVTDKKPCVDCIADDDDDITSCFPQFCTVCEKRMSNPCSSILYCSEHCRCEDTHKPVSAKSSSVPCSHSHPTTHIQCHDLDHSILPRISPTLHTLNGLFCAPNNSDAETNQRQHTSQLEKIYKDLSPPTGSGKQQSTNRSSLYGEMPKILAGKTSTT
jgi:ECL1/2/3 zinc binding proteins